MGKKRSEQSVFISQAKKNIQSLSTQLKDLDQNQDDILQLKSIQTILSYIQNDCESDNVVESTSTSTSSSTNESSSKFVICLKYTLDKVKCILKKLSLKLIPSKPSKSNLFGIFFCILAVIFYFELHTPPGFTRLWLKWENVEVSSVECTIERPQILMELFRPPLPCSFCMNITGANRVANITPSEFESRYAYSGRPVIITDAMSQWTAPSSFSFDFLKGIYSEGSRSLEHLGDDCLFFPYKTEFKSLAQVFNMTKERFKKRWYIGWSNCDADASHILRQHYQRPYFLPETAESTHADWIFMGNPGVGAQMHLDFVFNPSWQGQITGKKRWFLQPIPECLYQCHSFQIDVNPGDIIVIDTNRWYHQTQILPADDEKDDDANSLSITIGSEFD